MTKIIKNLKRKAVVTRDPGKEAVYRTLSEALGRSGYQVRREKLKQGPGWRVSSGRCRAEDRNIVFVDRRLTQEEQLSFLTGRILELKIGVDPELFQALPGPIQSILLGKAAA